jgi:hypothetical protein
MNIFDEVQILSEQPTNCSKCGVRTEIILDLSHTKDKTQIHKCLNDECLETFVTQFDVDFDIKNL